MGYTRRSLLQTLPLTLGGAFWGARRVLAAPTSRKLALLIGINHYPRLT